MLASNLIKNESVLAIIMYSVDFYVALLVLICSKSIKMFVFSITVKV